MTLADSIKRYLIQSAITDFLKKFSNTKEAKMFQGYKTYIVAVVMLALAALKFIGIEIPGFTETTDPGALIAAALGLVFSRNGAKTEVKKLL